MNNKHLNTKFGHMCNMHVLEDLNSQIQAHAHMIAYHLMHTPTKTDLRQKDIPSFHLSFSMRLALTSFITIMALCEHL